MSETAVKPLVVNVKAAPKAARVERMTRDEAEALIMLSGIMITVETELEALEKRSAWIPGLKRDLHLFKKTARRLRDAFKSTVPARQLDTITRSCACSVVNVGVRSVANKSVHEREWGQFVCNADLNQLMHAAKQQCMLCDLRRDQENKCPLKIAFDTIGTNIEHKGECGYRYEWDVPMEAYE